MSFLAISCLLVLKASAWPQPPVTNGFCIRDTSVRPIVKGNPTVLGIVTDPDLNRDSCGSVRFGNRALWTCRDTQFFEEDGYPQSQIFSSTASWTEFDANNMPLLSPSVQENAELPLGPSQLNMTGDQTGDPFFPILENECSSPSGNCDDGSRFGVWPDSPPLVATTSPSGAITAYTWILQAQFNPSTLVTIGSSTPPTTLYRTDYTPSNDRDALPTVTAIDATFYPEGGISFGNYGNFVFNGTAYLYGLTSTGVALARVPAAAIEDKSAYEYYVSNDWTSTVPSINSTLADIPNAGLLGQGTFFYHAPWDSFVWIGGSKFVGADFAITTAPSPMGPWIAPYEFYSAPVGNFDLSAYSLQAHPALANSPMNNSIFLTYTKNDLYKANPNNVYTTPLVYVEWE